MELKSNSNCLYTAKQKLSNLKYKSNHCMLMLIKGSKKMENFQNEDGSIDIPEVLKPYIK